MKVPIADIKLNPSNPRTIMTNILPTISTEKGELKIQTESGEVFYASNIKPKYRHDHRTLVIKNYSKYFHSLNNPTPIQQAYSLLLWYLFKDYLTAFSFRQITNKKSCKKDLYILRNSQGFIKIGVAKNVKTRIVDLEFEFVGKWEILKIYPEMGFMENELIYQLSDYLKPVKKNYSDKFSSECFEDCKPVLDACLNLS